MPLELGTIFGSCSVIAKISEGSMGKVYRARDTKLSQIVSCSEAPDPYRHTDHECVPRGTAGTGTACPL